MSITVTRSLSKELDAGSYRLVVGQRHAVFSDGIAATSTRLFQPNSTTPILAGSHPSGASVVYLDPADYATAGKTTYYRLRAVVTTNATSHGTQTFTFGLYPVSASAGGTDSSTITLGTVTTGSTVAVVDPASSSRITGTSGDFAAPAAGYFALGVVNSAGIATDATANLIASLEVRNT